MKGKILELPRKKSPRNEKLEEIRLRLIEIIREGDPVEIGRLERLVGILEKMAALKKRGIAFEVIYDRQGFITALAIKGKRFDGGTAVLRVRTGDSKTSG